MFKNLNLPNKLTIIRIILVPIFIVIMAIATMSEELKWFSFIALGIYALASITDFIDGKIARSKNLVTDFGKIMDPLADKILVAAGFIMLTYLKVIPGWVTAIIVCRDFIIDGFRMLASMKNIIVPAALVGKIKTFFQMFTIVLALLNYPISDKASIFSFVENGTKMPYFELLVNILLSICAIGAVIATIWSLISYMISFNAMLSKKENEEVKLVEGKVEEKIEE